MHTCMHAAGRCHDALPCRGAGGRARSSRALPWSCTSRQAGPAQLPPSTAHACTHPLARHSAAQRGSLHIPATLRPCNQWRMCAPIQSHRSAALLHSTAPHVHTAHHALAIMQAAVDPMPCLPACLCIARCARCGELLRPALPCPALCCAAVAQIKPYDAFGRQMMSNLETRGCPLRALPSTPTHEAHEARMTGNNWLRAGAHVYICSCQRPVHVGQSFRIKSLQVCYPAAWDIYI